MPLIPQAAAERNAAAEHLRNKEHRTPEETAAYLWLRMNADSTADEAKLMIVYEDSVTFRRVLARGIRGCDLKAFVDMFDVKK